MSSRKVIYIDYDSIKEIELEISKEGVIAFLENKNMVVSLDNDTYYYLMELKQQNNKLKNNIKKINL